MSLFKRLPAILFLLSISHLQAADISGVVLDKQTSLPVAGANVTLLKAGDSGTTDDRGRFSFSSDASSGGLSDSLVVTSRNYWEKTVPVTSSNASRVEIKLQAAKHRLVITTDIGGGDPDDLQSMVHALLLSNEFDLEGIIYGHAWVESNLPRGRQRIESAIDAYEAVYPNLKLHESEYPTPEYLRSIVRPGQTDPLMEGTGKGKDSEGSNLIIELADNKDDSRPLWLNAWGGANTIAQAYWKVNDTRSPEEIAAFVRKIRVYDILGQCDSGSWISKTFPDSVYIRNADGVYGWAPSKEWSAEHVQSHGPLGKIYPTAKWATEGDSPAFMHLASRGLNDPNELTQGGWGGRFGPGKKTGVKLFSWAEKNETVNAHDMKLRPYWIYTNTEEGTDAIRKWREDIYASQAARMDWSVTPEYSDANHFPIAVLEGETTRQILEMAVKPGQQLTLDATGSSDPDGDDLRYSWHYYDEASSYHGNVAIEGAELSSAQVSVPQDASGKSIHIILTLHDDGYPSLAAYRRMILNVD